MLEHQADVNIKSPPYHTLLEDQQKKFKKVKKAFDHETPLMIATYKEDLDSVKKLVQRHAIIDESNYKGFTCLIYAARLNKNNKETREGSFCWLCISSILVAKTPPPCYSSFIMIQINHYRNIMTVFWY